MSVSFHPAINYNAPCDENSPCWSGHYVQHRAWNDLPEFYRQEKFQNIDYEFWSAGLQTLQYWQDKAKELRLTLIETYPCKKIWADDKNFSIVLVATGEQIEHTNIEMSLANANARALCQLLNIDEDAGRMHPFALLEKIEQVKNGDRFSEFTRDYSDSGDDAAPLGISNGPRMISFGLDENRLMAYLLKLEKICDHCIMHECDVSWG